MRYERCEISFSLPESPCFYLCSYLVTIPFTTNAHTHPHTHTHTSRKKKLQQTLSEYISPRVDNVTFPVFHYLVLTVREHLARFPPSLCIYFGISGMFWEQLLLCVIAMALHHQASLHIWRVKTEGGRIARMAAITEAMPNIDNWWLIITKITEISQKWFQKLFKNLSKMYLTILTVGFFGLFKEFSFHLLFCHCSILL